MITGPSEFQTSDSPPLITLFDPTVAQTFGPLTDQDRAELEELFPKPQGGIGDVNSSAKGSGARFNAGKPDLSLIPLRFIADDFSHRNRDPLTEAQSRALAALYRLASFQETGRVEYLYQVLLELGDCWAECAHVFDYGRKKYAEWNWAKGMPWSVPLACAARHLLNILVDLQELDDESGRLHSGHVYCNVVMLMQYQTTYKAGDNLPRQLRTGSAT